MQNSSTLCSAVSQPLVTFVIPVYNVPLAMLRECVENVLRLSLRPEEREILLIDDGSDEPVAERLGEWAAEMRCFRTENRGLGPARNLGLQHARGRFVQFLDSDDYLVPAVYDACVERLRRDDIDLLQFRFTRTPGVVAQKVSFSPVVSGASHLEHHNMRAAVWSYVVRLATLGDLRFENIYSEDEEFTPRLLLRVNRMVSTKATAYYYRLRQDSIIQTTNREKQEKRMHDVQGIVVGLRRLSLTLDSQDAKAGIERRACQLTMDLLYNLVRDPQIRGLLPPFVRELRQASLFPLPLRFYTLKYFLFALATRLFPSR